MRFKQRQRNPEPKRVINREWEWGPKQIEGADYLNDRGAKGALLGLEMRLGKTDLTTDKTARDIIDKGVGRILVIAPDDVVQNWSDTYTKVEGVAEEKVRIISGMSKAKREKVLNDKSILVVITNPRAVIPARLAEYVWAGIIVDEAHVLSDPRSNFSKYMNGGRVQARKSRLPYRKRIADLWVVYRDKSVHGNTRRSARRKLRNLLKYRKDIRKEPPAYESAYGFDRPRNQYRFALNGNPFAEGPTTPVCQVIWSHGSFMGCTDWWEFRDRFMQQDPFEDHNWELKKGVEEKVIQYCHHIGFIRLRDGEGQQKKYMKIEVAPPKDVLKEEKKMKVMFEADGQSTMYPMVRDGFRYRLLNGHKLDTESGHRWLGKHEAVLKFVQDYFDGSEFIVWSRFTRDLHAMQKLCSEAGLNTKIINGGVKREDRWAIKEEFQRGELDGVLLQYASCYRGLRFSSAWVSCYLNHPLSGDQRSQSEDRHIDAYAEGNKWIVDFFAPKTLDHGVALASMDKTLTGKSLMKHANYLTEALARGL